MVKHTIRISLISLLAAVMLLGASPIVYADGGDKGNADAVIDISIKGDPKVEIVANGACVVKVKREASSEANTVSMFLSPDPVTYSDSSGKGTVINISISGESEVDILASGTCQVNVRVEGPARVNIEASDEVELNIEASDESQVFVDDEKVNDNPSEGLTPDVEASDPYQALVSDQNDGAPGDDHSSGLNSLAIISGAFLAAGLPCFFLIRRKAKNKTRQLNNEKGEEVKK